MKIRGDILRTYQAMHTWTGIVAGLVLFIGFYAGSLTMFQHEISQWATPPSHQLSSIDHDKYDLLISKASTEFEPARQGFTLHFNTQSSPMTWYEQGGGRGLNLTNVMRHASLSAEGELVSQASTENKLGSLIDMLHRTAGIGGQITGQDLGEIIVGVAAILYFLALVSGVIFLLPTLMKSFFALRKDKGSNRFWLDSHNLVGVASLPFHFIIAWTVVVFCFHDVFYGGLSIVYGDKPLFERGEKAEIIYQVNDLPPIEHYVEKVNQLAPGYHVDQMTFSGLSTQRPSLGITVKNSDEVMRNTSGDFIYMDPFTLAVAFTSIPQDEEDVYTALVASFFSLHFGGYGGNLGRWLYFVMGILGAFLFYSGNLLWLEKRRQKKGQQTRASKVMSSLTIGICLGSIAGVVVTLVASRWLYILNSSINSSTATPINDSYLLCYYLIFFTVLSYSFIRGAAKSAIELLYLLSFACLCIPLTSIVAIIFPELGLWSTSHFAGVIIEFIALIFTGVFYLAAKKAKQRAYFGEANSIWALPQVTIVQTTITEPLVTESLLADK